MHHIAVQRYAILCLILLVSTVSFAQDQTPIYMWTTYENEQLEWLQSKAEEFNALLPDHQILIESFASDEVILTAFDLDLDTEPVIIHIQDDSTQRILDAQIVQDLETIVDGRDAILDVPVNFDDWFASVQAHARVNDQWMMIPLHSNTAMIYVNIDLLTELGSSFAFVPQDWTTIELICDEILSAIDDGQIDGCVAWQDTAWLFEHWLAQQNIPLTDSSNGRDVRATEINLLSESAISTVEFMRRMVEWGYLADSNDATIDESVEAFNNGRLPILFADNSIALSLDVEFEGDVLSSNVDFGWSGARLDTDNLWIADDIDPEIADVALAFSQFLTNPENNVEWHQATGSLPLSETAYDMLLDSEWIETHPEQVNISRALTDSIADSATLFAVMGQGDIIRADLGIGLDGYIFGTDNIRVNDALQALQDELLNRLEIYNLTNAPDID